MDKSKKFLKILWAVCVIPLLIGVILIQTENSEYPTSEYWVAQGYHHVYERSSGQIVDMIESNETCVIKGNKIIVKKKGKAYGFGVFLVVLFGMFTLGCVWGTIESSDWWYNLTSKK